MISARLAGPDDMPCLVALATLAIEELQGTRGGAVWASRHARPQPVEPSLEAALKDPSVLVLAGEIGGTVVGYSVTRVEDLRDGSRLGVIDDIYVHPEGRAVSVGEAMADKIVAWCREQGCRVSMAWRCRATARPRTSSRRSGSRPGPSSFTIRSTFSGRFDPAGCEV